MYIPCVFIVYYLLFVRTHARTHTHTHIYINLLKPTGYVMHH
jgi:hypothetical protein